MKAGNSSAGLSAEPCSELVDRLVGDRLHVWETYLGGVSGRLVNDL